jgi:hypothetical protein
MSRSASLANADGRAYLLTGMPGDTRAFRYFVLLISAAWSIALGPTPTVPNRTIRPDTSRRPTRASYLVTVAPLQFGVGDGLCLAVDPADAAGIWWWEPGRTGCSSRSTSTAFHAENARVGPRSGDIMPIAFRMQVHARPTEPAYRDIALELKGTSLRAGATGASVEVRPRDDLDIPLRCC